MQKTISGTLFRKMINGSAKVLEENKKLVDSLNVFPVPDGDTGTNMSLTYNSATKELNNCLEKHTLHINKELIFILYGNGKIVIKCKYSICLWIRVFW